MTQFYVPQTPTTAKCLALPGAERPRLLAELQLDTLVNGLPIETRLDHKARKKSPIGLYPAQKLDRLVRDVKYAWGQNGVCSILGVSSSGRDFMAVALPDSSLILGQVDPMSGMVKLFPFPLVSTDAPTAESISLEFDAWEALCDAAPKLHLISEEPADRPDRKIPTWRPAATMEEGDQVKLRDFCSLAASVFCARHDQLRHEPFIRLRIHSRDVMRNASLGPAGVSIALENKDFEPEASAFIEDVMRILDGPASPIPAERQIKIHHSDHHQSLSVVKRLLAAGPSQSPSWSAHDMIEAETAWLEMLRQSH